MKALLIGVNDTYSRSVGGCRSNHLLGDHSANSCYGQLSGGRSYSIWSRIDRPDVMIEEVNEVHYYVNTLRRSAWHALSFLDHLRKSRSVVFELGE